MRPFAVNAALILLGAPLVAAVQTDGRGPGSIPNLDIPNPPKWEDVEHPEFEPYPVDSSNELQDGAVFEQFDGKSSEVFKRWQVSKATRNGEEPFTGEWAIEEPKEFKGFNHDNGLVLKSEQTAAAIARKLEPALDVSSAAKPWVVQYEVKLQKPLRCGGAYLKLLPSTTDNNWSQFSNDTPYLVMFGPDKCGSTDKVHFILRRDGKEHHLVGPPRTRGGLLSTLYTLVVNEDQTFEIRMDGMVMRAGSLLNPEDFEPPLAPPREIDDPNDTKPADWVDEELIPDPNELSKPDDWNEDAPYLIHDPEAVKPEAWRDDLPLFIVDPDAAKPEYWDDEEDGEWTAPEIVNPECVDLDDEAGEGCGEWLAPLIRNPDFKGKWTQPLIVNPDFKGPWEPRKIPNPEFDDVNIKPGQLEQNIGGIGFELLTVQGDILFDNIYVGHSIRDAENLGNATWSPKYYIENSSQARATEAYKKQAQEANEGLNLSLLDRYRRELEDFRLDPKGYSYDTYNMFIELFRTDKVTAVKEFPITALVASVSACALSAIVFGLFNILLVGLTGRSIEQQRKTPRVHVENVDDNSEAKGEKTNEEQGDSDSTD